MIVTLGQQYNVGEKPTVMLCVCVCVFSSHSFWTSTSLDVPAGVTQEEGHTGFLIHLLSAVRALIFLARRIHPFLSLVELEVEFCVVVVVVVVSHIQRIGCQPEKTTLHGGQSRSWSAEQGKENKRKITNDLIVLHPLGIFTLVF